MFEKVEVVVTLRLLMDRQNERQTRLKTLPLSLRWRAVKNLAKFIEANVYFFNWNEKSEAQKHP